MRIKIPDGAVDDNVHLSIIQQSREVAAVKLNQLSSSVGSKFAPVSHLYGIKALDRPKQGGVLSV